MPPAVTFVFAMILGAVLVSMLRAARRGISGWRPPEPEQSYYEDRPVQRPPKFCGACSPRVQSLHSKLISQIDSLEAGRADHDREIVTTVARELNLDNDECLPASRAVDLLCTAFRKCRAGAERIDGKLAAANRKLNHKAMDTRREAFARAQKHVTPVAPSDSDELGDAVLRLAAKYEAYLISGEEGSRPDLGSPRPPASSD
jgi:hypothetical protein